MPLLRLETTVALTEDKQQALLASLSKIVAETIGKPQQYVMVTASQVAIQMSGSPGDAAFVDVRSIGGLTAWSTGSCRRRSASCCTIRWESRQIAFTSASPMSRRAIGVGTA